MPSLSSRGPDIAAVCCHFNPCHYASRVRNYGQFREAIDASGIRLLTVELAFGDDPFELPHDDHVLAIRGGDVLWQKERLLQIGAERLLEDGVGAIVFLDADVRFEETDWPVTIARSLERAPVVQCFERVTVDFAEEVLHADSGVKHFTETGALSGRVGYGWAMRAELFAETGLYQHCVVGGGDSMLFIAAIGLASQDQAWVSRLHPHDFLKYAGDKMLSHYRAWANGFVAATGGDVGYAPLTLTAMAHGARKNRGYEARHHILAGFDPHNSVVAEPGQPWRWVPAETERAKAVRDYFQSRNEDVS